MTIMRRLGVLETIISCSVAINGRVMRIDSMMMWVISWCVIVSKAW